MDKSEAKKQLVRSGFQIDRESSTDAKLISRRGKWRLVWDASEPDSIYVREVINGFAVPARAHGVEIKPEDTMRWLEQLPITTLDVLVPRWCEIKGAMEWVECEHLDPHDRVQVAIWGRMTGKYAPKDAKAFFFTLAHRAVDVVGGIADVLAYARECEQDWNWEDPQTILRVMSQMATEQGRLNAFYAAVLGHKGTHSLKTTKPAPVSVPADANLGPSKRSECRASFSAPAPVAVKPKAAFTPRYFRYDGPQILSRGAVKTPIRGGITIERAPEYISTFDPQMGPLTLVHIDSALASKKWVEITKAEYAAMEMTE